MPREPLAGPLPQKRKGDTATAKYRFWLVVLCLVLSAFLGTLAIGALSAGDGMAHDLGIARDDFLTRYEILSFGLWALAAGALYLGYKIRPGGD